ncbi:MAG: DivIVA domain-containing protein [Clostridia bacterium]|nr:DivIVA domain-containing protein [Clostridia bacterium]
MLAPHELKGKTFSKSLKGYNPAEVEEYIEFLLEKYAEAYRENNELERKLQVVVTNLDEIKDEEESIRSTLISAQKMADKIIQDANERSDIITGAVKERCDAVIAEFKEQLRAEKEEMWELRSRIVDFKKDLFRQYRAHIEDIKAVSVNELDDIVLPNEEVLVTRIFSDVKQGIDEETAKDAFRRKDELEEEPMTLRGPGVERPDLENAPELTGPEKAAEDAFLEFMLKGEPDGKPEGEPEDGAES